MKQYLADLHIHTCLSPCGSLEMSPSEIVRRSLAKGLDAIAITDHNTTLQCPEIQFLGERVGLKVFAGVEVTTREEAHCLVYFETDESRRQFQLYLEEHLPPVPNDPKRFGDQVWVNAEDEILGEVPHLLLSALDQSVNQLSVQVHRAGALFVAAHVERPSFSLISQLGFIAPDLSLDAVEYNNYQRYSKLLPAHGYLKKYTQYSASDAHHPEQIGTQPSIWQTEELAFEGLRKAFSRKDNHSIFASHG
ncbi:PHP domain-containing protein [uncultured Parabacteroides sp.]|uniref:PHP domain-containing protein n=1 Tax=uncultured Parabacteroides sp. TaxID=512312 RepID=UPI002631D614|nr:PHP domain-containing protein [uncultured Parabacteroides sp.]